ncbi:xylulokinase [Vibrio cholerae]|uniref:xylulokinase n=1 Tax=Vibrio TaxID=662 RepID=UPI0004E33CEF|nr:MULTISPECIES: xylulokinase [Vibrio]KFD81855.1 xylulokinase [Vibrio paracholerae]QAV06897.1 Xylulose kinase [Vibrio cholerae]TXX92294.1 xylulokinase [Vibrio cholerae]TXX93510.1 xylulokinase [Vibrio cholerae]GHW11557.1 xylulokinase [Vibrio cholerae]
MYIGIDLGTSGVKSIVMSLEGEILASKSIELSVSRPKPLWSEQMPAEWWHATCESIRGLREQIDLSGVKAVGLSGQMHGATLLNAEGEVIRPAILWNDGRCAAECNELELAVPESRAITGNIMMPGFTAPKLKWVRNNEPENFEKIAKVLLPKDYLRFKMTGDFASDMSDSAGTCWLDVNARDWSEELLTATGLTREQMPTLFEGSEVTGVLLEQVAEQWGLPQVPVVAGGGDNAAGAVGVGIIKPGQAMLSLGTSGVYFAVSDGFISNPESALHSFCHALPNCWHTMSVILSAASCLKWVASLTGFEDVGEMIKEVEQNADETSSVIFLPYLSGERTPHNNPDAKGVFFGMTHSTTKLELAQAVLEGVGFAFADGFDALHVTKMIPDEVSLIGGGARSEYWRQMLADIVGLPLTYRKGGDVGPALGAARLAALAVEENADIEKICPVPELVQLHQPNSDKQAYYNAKRETFQSLYARISDLF